MRRLGNKSLSASRDGPTISCGLLGGVVFSIASIHHF
jgi:hypothetical protein